jgi:gliding motility-associated-like protein
MTIVDRWGEVVFKTNRMEETWDGTYKGEACGGDTYMYIIDVTDHFGERHYKKGNLTLIR